jgi:tRNA-dihydrouridine synthase A
MVAQCVDAMRQASDIPVSVKSRIGVDDMESYEQLSNFITQIENAGCENFAH